MTLLKKQLTLLCSAAFLGGALLWTANGLHAQDKNGVRSLLGIKTPRQKMTRDDAARNFVALLEGLHQKFDTENDEPDATMMSSFSRKSETESLSVLLLKMAKQWNAPDRTVKVVSEGEGTATITLETNPQPAPKPLILIQEGDSWGVDVMETYAKWNNLEGAAKEEALARISTESIRERENARRSSCQSNLKQIASGLAMYAQDYDEKLPPAKSWVDVLWPYVKSEEIFTCPSVTDAKGYGYAYNSKLSNKFVEILPSTSETVSVFETSILKRNAYGMGENPAFRHEGGANYCFADGHVEWFDKSEIPSFNVGRPTPRPPSPPFEYPAP